MADKQPPGNKSKVDNLKFMKKQEKAEEKQIEKAIRADKPTPTDNSFFARIQQFAEKLPETAESAIQRNAIDPRTELASKEPTRYNF